MTLEEKLTNFCSGYSSENHSVGRTLSFIALSNEIDKFVKEHHTILKNKIGININSLDLKDEDLCSLGDKVKSIRQEDLQTAIDGANIILKNVFNSRYKVSLDDSDMQKLTQKKEFAKLLLEQNKKIIKKLPKSTQEKIKKFEKDYDNITSCPVDMYYWRKNGVIVSARIKTDKSLIIKYLHRLRINWMPSDEKRREVYGLTKTTNTDDYRYRFWDCFIRTLTNGQNFESYYTSSFNGTDLCEKLLLEDISRLYLFDAGGVKLIPPTEKETLNMISWTQKYGNRKGLKLIARGQKDYFIQKIKDMSNVYPIIGSNERNFAEIREQALWHTIVGTFGSKELDIKGHDDYKEASKDIVLIDTNEDKFLYQAAENLCKAFKIDLNDLFEL